MDKNQTKEVNQDRTDPNSPYYTPAPVLDSEQLHERKFDLMRLYQIAQLRESPWPQFDGMGYMKYNETNEMADISFLPPKKNKGDTRITTGVTHEKDSSLVSFYLNMNFEGSVRVFHGNKEEIEMGTTLTKLVRKSRELEGYDNKRAQFYRNYTAQGTAFTREQYIELWVPNKKIIGEVNPARLDEVSWVEQGLMLQQALCETNLVDGKKVFLENIREPNIQKQPGVYTVEYISRALLESIWGQTAMWKYVPYLASAGGMDSGTLTQGSIYSDWIYGEVDYSKLEVVTVYRPFEQRFQIYFNGIPMLKTKYPLRAVSPSGKIPIAKGDQDLMNMFAYSKSDPAKTKIDQAVFDEILQTMVTKSRQSASVPRVNNTGKILTPDMFLGGKIISNLNPKDVEPLIETPGITASDFSFYQVFKEHIDSKTISSILEGQATGKDMTLGEYLDQQKRAMLKIGAKIDGIIQWEKQMLELRTMNILAHGAQQAPGGGYKDITTEGTMFDGSKGLNVIKFDKNNIRSPYEVYNQELKYKQQNGTDIEYTYIDPVQMKNMIDDPEYYFCYEIVPVDKNNDKITQVMFINMITQASTLFGADSLQVSHLKRRYAQIMNEPYDNLFKTEEEMQITQQQNAQAGVVPGTDANAPSPTPSPMDSQMQVNNQIPKM